MSDKLTVAETYPIEGFWQTQITTKRGGEVFAITPGRTEKQSRERAEGIVSFEARVRELEVRNSELEAALRVTMEIAEDGDTGADFKRVGMAMQAAHAALTPA